MAEGARLESVYTGNRIVGSNPTPSARFQILEFCIDLQDVNSQTESNTALVGPLVYIITKRYGEIISEGQRFSLTIAFPRGISFVLVSAVICIFAGFAFGTMKNPALVPVSGVVLNSNGIFWTSIFIYLLSLYCVFSASVYRNALSDFLQDSSSGEESFSLAINVERSGT